MVVKIICRSLLQETFVVEDCIYYNNGTLTGNNSLSISNIPTNFKASYKLKATSSTNADDCWLEVGSDSNNFILFGETSSQYNRIGIFVKQNGSYIANQDSSNNVLVSGVETEVTYTYNDGVQTVSANGTDVTLTNSTITGRSYVYTRIKSDNYMKELKIKAL